MTNGRTLSTVLPVLVAVLGVGILGYGAWRLTSVDDVPEEEWVDSEEEYETPETEPGPGEHWEKVEAVEVDDWTAFPGEVRAEGSVEIRAPQGMRVPVTRIHREIGQFVKKGEPLITFHREAIVKAIAEAKARGDTADQARFEVYLEHDPLVAPNDGQVVNIHTNVGEVPFDVGIPLMTLTDAKRFSLVVSIPGELVTDSAPLGREMTVDFGAPYEGEEPLGQVKGTVTSHGEDARMGPSEAVEGDHTLVVLGLEPKEGLVPGMIGQVRLPTGKKQILLVPKAAVIWRGDLAVVRAWEEEGIAERTIMTEGETRGDKLVVLYGVSAGQPVVVPEGRR